MAGGVLENHPKREVPSLPAPATRRCAQPPAGFCHPLGMFADSDQGISRPVTTICCPRGIGETHAWARTTPSTPARAGQGGMSI